MVEPAGPPSIAIGHDGLALVRYVGREWVPGGFAGPSHLSVATCRDHACSEFAIARILRSTHSGALYDSAAQAPVAIGSDGFPVIAFHADGAVMVAKCASRSCE